MPTLPSRNFSITMPYGSMKSVPREHRRQHERVRMEIQDAEITARQTLRSADRWERDWSEDLDPSPQGVRRTSDSYGEERSIEVQTNDEPGQYAQPSRMVEEKVGKVRTSADFENGQVVRLEQRLHGFDGGVEDMTIEVNREDHTVTYTIHETGEFALQPLEYQISSAANGGESSGTSPSYSNDPGPDGVYDEYDNSNRGGGPDAVYNEWDNGRGSYFEGPDGRTSYDPY